MICAIFERRPRTTRSIMDPRAAKPVGRVEFEDQRRHHENVNKIVLALAEMGHKMASTPSKSTHPEFDFVVYVEPSPATSQREAAIQMKSGADKKKPVSVGGSGGVGRRLPLPSGRKKR